MTARRRVAAVDDAAQTDAVTIAPDYTARHAVTQPSDGEDPNNPRLRVDPTKRYPLSVHSTNPEDRAKPGSADDRFEQAMRWLGDYWARACASAWFTVFPRGSFAEIRDRWFPSRAKTSASPNEGADQ